MTKPAFLAELGFGGFPGSPYMLIGDATRGIGTGLIAPSSFFTDTSNDVRSVTITSGRQRALDAYKDATATWVLGNGHGDYDPNNLSGPYVASGSTELLPMLPGRFRAAWAGVNYDLYRGYADSFAVQYRGPRDSTCTIQFIGGFGVLAGYDPPGPSNPIGAGEDAGARIRRVALAAGWSAADLDLDTGDRTLQATTLATNALTEIRDAAESEQGFVWMSPDNKLTFRSSTSRMTNPRSTTSQCTFGDGGGAELPYVDVIPQNDSTLIRNSSSGTIAGGTVQTAADSASIGQYATRSYNTTNLWLDTDIAARHWAEWNVYRYKDADPRIDSITVNPYKTDALWPYVLGLKFGDLVTVIRRPPFGDTITRLVFVEGIDHTITPKSWTTKFYFSDASKIVGQMMIIGSGLIGTGKVAA